MGNGKKLEMQKEKKFWSEKNGLINLKYTPRANNIGAELSDDNLNTFIGEQGTICTESYLVLGATLELDNFSAETLKK